MKKSTIIILIIIVVAIVWLGAQIYCGPDPHVEYNNEIPDSHKIMINNDQFTEFWGKNKRYSEVMTLISRVKDHNNNDEIVAEFGQISISKLTSSDFTISAEYADINTTGAKYEITEEMLKPSKAYTIEPKEYNKIGAICNIGIYEQEGYAEY